MSSLIPTIGAYLPAPVQMVLRAAAPIAVDYLGTRLRNHQVSWIPALGTFLLLNRNVTTQEKISNALLYVAYKALHIYFFSRAKNKDAKITSTTDPLSSVSNFEKLQTKVKELISFLTWRGESSFDKINPSVILKTWSDPMVTTKATAIFELAAKDSSELHEKLTMATFDEKDRYKKMAELLMDKTQPYYARFCDPGRPSILFLYHFAREYGYFTRVGGMHYPHALSLENSEIQPFFYQENTVQSNWRSIYNEHVELWANVLKHLPANSVRQWAVKDTPESPLKPVSFPDNFLMVW